MMLNTVPFILPRKTVKLGEYNTNKTTDCVTYEDYDECSDPVIDVNVEEVIVHPLYNFPAEVRYDIALTRLAKNIRFNGKTYDITI